MSYLALSKILSSSLSLSTTAFHLTSWILFGRRESKEIQLAVETNKKLDLLQKQLDQFWVIQNNLLPDTTIEVDEEGVTCTTGDASNTTKCFEKVLMLDMDGSETLLTILDNVI
jgi:hypothetical protein